MQDATALNEDATALLSKIQAVVQGYSSGVTQHTQYLEAVVEQRGDQIAMTSARANELQEQVDALRLTLSEHDAASRADKKQQDALLERCIHVEEALAQERQLAAEKEAKAAALRTEAANLRAELDTVYASIAGLLRPREEGVAKAFEKVAQNVRQFGETVGAVCVAAKEEVAEAVCRTHEYARKDEADKAAAAADADDADVEQEELVVLPTMPRVVVNASATIPATAATVAVADDGEEEEEELQEEEDKALSSAITTLSSMGFNTSVAELKVLMAQHNGDITLVLNDLLSSA